MKLNEFKKYLIFDFDWTLCFNWVIRENTINILKKLSLNYSLFITTKSSTRKTNEILEKYWIKDLFEIVYWSEEVLKSVEHINYFEDYSCDENFREKALLIWDWEIDRNLASDCKIEFIYIWSEDLSLYLGDLLL